MRTSRSSKRCSDSLFAALAWVATCGVGVAQSEQPQPEKFGGRLEGAALEAHALLERKEHLSVVACERRTRFLEHYAQADSARRERALELLEAARPAGASTGWQPSAALLRRAEALLQDRAESATDAELERFDALAGALDLVAIPGAFELREKEPTTPVTVRVTLLSAAQARDCEFVLEWIDSARRQVHARKEPVDARGFAGQGFDMFLRAPLCEPGACWLYGRIAPRGVAPFAVRTAEIRVDAIERLDARLAALRERSLGDHPGYVRLGELLTSLIVRGARRSASLGGADVLAALETWSESGPAPGSPVPIEALETAPGGAERWLWSYSPSATPRRALALFAGPDEPADAPFAGAAGLEWMRWAERSATQLFAVNAPTEPGELETLLARLRAWSGGLEFGVVVRDDAWRAFSLGLATLSGQPFGAWIVNVSTPASTHGALLAGCPGLLVAPGPAPAARPGLEWVEGARLPLIEEALLPAHVEAWFTRRESVR
jgi:hypothetical protein